MLILSRQFKSTGLFREKIEKNKFIVGLVLQANDLTIVAVSISFSTGSNASVDTHNRLLKTKERAELSNHAATRKEREKEGKKGALYSLFEGHHLAVQVYPCINESIYIGN